MGQILFTVSANSVPFDIRANLYKTTSSNVVAYSQDIPLPHNVSQALAFDPIDDGTYYVRLYELTAPNTLGQLLFEQIMSTKQKDLYQQPNLEIRAGTDMVAGQDIYDGSGLYPANNGLVALVDYWVEREGQGTFKEIVDFPPFGFRLDLDRDGNTVNFNPDEKFTIHFYPKVKITVGSGTVSASADVVEVNGNTVLDPTYLNKIIDINGNTRKIRIEMDYMVNIPDGSSFTFLTGRGNQVNAIIAAKPSEVFVFDCGTAVGYGSVSPTFPTDLVMGSNEYLTIVKKAPYFFVQTNVSYDNIGHIEMGTRLKRNRLLADGASTFGNELDPTEYVRLFREVSLMADGVLSTKVAWLASNRTQFYNDVLLGKFGVPDLRGYGVRFLNGARTNDPDRTTAGTNNFVLSSQPDAVKLTSFRLPIARTNNTVSSGIKNQLRVTDDNADTSVNGLQITYGTGGDTHMLNFAPHPFIII